MNSLQVTTDIAGTPTQSNLATLGYNDNPGPIPEELRVTMRRNSQALEELTNAACD
jgi:hypothetical protein